MTDTTVLRDEQLAAWQRAQALWGVQMHEARLSPGEGERRGSFAWFTFPPEVAVDPELLVRDGIADELESVFAHELGHHVLAPATRIDSLKIRQQMARALVAAGSSGIRADQVSFLANLWCDLLVNVRVAALQRRADAGANAVPMQRLMRAIFSADFEAPGRLWWVYRRTYEVAWSLPAGTMCPVTPPPRPAHDLAAAAGSHETPIEDLPERFQERERALRAAKREAERVATELDRATLTSPDLDADLVARVVRTFGGDPVAGALRFGVIAAPYVVELERDREHAEGAGAAAGSDSVGGGMGAGRRAGTGGCAADDAAPTAEELGRILGDPRLSGPLPDRFGEDPRAADAERPGDEGSDGLARGRRASAGDGAGQGFGVARTLELYPTADADAVVAAWYRTHAAPWVHPLTERRPSRLAAELPGPIELWDAGDELADLDWSATLQAGATVVPGVTTRKRSQLDDEPETDEASVDLDLYIDSSGSMPSPRGDGSPAVLAGTILALSALRGGGRVRVTSFSGAGQVAGDERFLRNTAEIVAGLAFFFGGGTTFPLDRFGERYAKLAPPTADERRHVVVLSDDGLSSMFGVGNAPYAHVAAEVRTKLTTATLVVIGTWATAGELAGAAGYDVRSVASMADVPRVCAELAEVLHG